MKFTRKGVRVRLSPAGQAITRKAHHNRVGTIVGGTLDGNIRVLWDGLKRPYTYHPTFVIGEDEEFVER